MAVTRDAIVASRPTPLIIGYYLLTSDSELCATLIVAVVCSMLGYPSTVGSDFVDFIVTDRIITPPEVKAHFTEKFMYMPYSYQVNSQKDEEVVATLGSNTTAPTREAYGLPKRALVLSCFNSLSVSNFLVYCIVYLQQAHSQLSLPEGTKSIQPY